MSTFNRHQIDPRPTPCRPDVAIGSSLGILYAGAKEGRLQPMAGVSPALARELEAVELGWVRGLSALHRSPGERLGALSPLSPRRRPYHLAPRVFVRARLCGIARQARTSDTPPRSARCRGRRVAEPSVVADCTGHGGFSGRRRGMVPPTIRVGAAWRGLSLRVGGGGQSSSFPGRRGSLSNVPNGRKVGSSQSLGAVVASDRREGASWRRLGRLIPGGRDHSEEMSASCEFIACCMRARRSATRVLAGRVTPQKL